jgi:recombinational DNA repair protein RecT
MRSDKVKKIWCEIVYEGDDFEYELGLEPKLVHAPNHSSIRNSSTVKYIYACAKINDEVIFKVMAKQEIQQIANMAKYKNDLYFNDAKDPEQWMAKKTVLKQLAKLMPRDDDRLKKAVSMDDNIEGGGYLIMDENDTVKFVQGTVIKEKSNIYQKLLQNNGTSISTLTGVTAHNGTNSLPNISTTENIVLDL